MNTVDKIKCPNCGKEIDVNMALSHEIETKILKEQEAEFSRRLKAESDKIRDTVTKENEDGLKSLQKALKEKSEQVIELNKTKAEVERLRLEKEEIEFRIAAEKDAELSKKLKEEREAQKVRLGIETERIRKEATEESALKMNELQKKLDVQTAMTEEMQRKLEQGSMQLQGEVQELAIEDILKETFLFDLIEPVPKGIRGADVVHKVRNNIGHEVGIIVYESKRTKAFVSDWTGKLKEDGARVNADIFVLVTDVLPPDIDRIGQKDGVWICTFSELRGLSLALRDSIIRVSAAFSSQTNRGEKTQMLYDYLTGKEFSSVLRTVVETFDELQKGYLDERKKMERIWKEREKQLDKIVLNMSSFIGSIKGIAGSSLSEIAMIENNEQKFLES